MRLRMIFSCAWHTHAEKFTKKLSVVENNRVAGIIAAGLADKKKMFQVLWNRRVTTEYAGHPGPVHVLPAQDKSGFLAL